MWHLQLLRGTAPLPHVALGKSPQHTGDAQPKTGHNRGPPRRWGRRLPRATRYLGVVLLGRDADEVYIQGLHRRRLQKKKKKGEKND